MDSPIFLRPGPLCNSFSLLLLISYLLYRRVVKDSDL